MIEQLRVRSLGVIDDIDIALGPGLTAITGETGTGKTLIVEALELLVGGKSDASLVRFGQEEAIVEGLFVVDEDETVVSRIVPQSGRSRATINDRLATLAALEEFGRSPGRPLRSTRPPVAPAPGRAAPGPRRVRRGRPRAGACASPTARAGR